MTLRVLDVLKRIRSYPGRAPDSLLAAVLKNLPVLLVLTLLMWLLEWRGCCRGLEMYALDTLLRINVSDQSDRIVLVVIDDEDYSSQFAAKSPLDAKLVLQGVAAICQGKPKVVGVDLDTMSADYAKHIQRYRASPDNVIWARTALCVAEHESASQGGNEHGLQVVDPKDFLGGQFREHLDEASSAGDSAPCAGRRLTTEPKSGIVLLPCDSDGVIRRYWRAFYSRSSGGPLDSFPWAVVQEYLREPTTTAAAECRAFRHLSELQRQSLEGHEAPLVNFSCRPNRFQVIRFSDLFVKGEASTKDDSGESHQPRAQWSGPNSPFQDRIVLLGGRYAAARDAHVTPIGPLYGLDLLAEIIDAECEQRLIYEVNCYVAALLHLASGLLLVVFNWRFRAAWAFYFNILLIAGLSMAASILAFHTAAYWFNSTAVLIGVWMHFQWDQAREARAMRNELKEYRERFGQLSHR